MPNVKSIPEHKGFMEVEIIPENWNMVSIGKFLLGTGIT